MLLILKFFQNWGGGLELSPFFTLRYVSVLGDKTVSTHVKKTFNEVFLTPRFNNGGVRENLYFSRYINTCGGKSYYS